MLTKSDVHVVDNGQLLLADGFKVQNVNEAADEFYVTIMRKRMQDVDYVQLHCTLHVTSLYKN